MNIVWKNFTDSVFDQTGGNMKILSSNYLVDGKLPVVDQGKNLIAGFVNDESIKCKVDLPCIIFGDHTKIFKYIDFPFALGADGIKVLKPSNEFNVKYLYYYLTQIKLAGKNSYNRNFKYLKIIKLPLIPLTAQKRIAETLGKADSIRQKRKESISLLDEFLKSVFLEMFGDPVRNEKGWERKIFQSIVEDYDYGLSDKADEDASGVPMLRMNNITYEGRIDISNLKYINAKRFNTSKYLLKKNDFLFNRTNSPELVGKCSVWNLNDNFTFAGYLIRFRFMEALANPYYVSHYFNSSYGKKFLFSRAKPSINMSNISASTLMGFRILIPPIKLQTQFAEIVEQVEKTKAKMEESLREMDNQFEGLMGRVFR